MANYYVRSGAGGAGTGADWANAYTTLTTALSGKTSSDTLWVANDHSESTAASVTLTCPSTAGLQILGVNTNATEPPTGLNSTPAAIVTLTGNSTLTVNGFAYIYGINFNGSTNNNSSCDVAVAASNASHGLFFDNCTFYVQSANTSAFFTFGNTGSATNDDTYVKIKDSKIRLSSTAGLAAQAGRHHFINVSLNGAGSDPTSLLVGLNDANGTLLWENSDITDGGTATCTNLVNQAWGATYDVTFRNCRVPSSVAVVTGTHTGIGGVNVKMHNCDSADTNYRFAEHSWQGSAVSQTGTLVMTGGSTDASGTLYSYKMVGSTNAEVWGIPLLSPEFKKYNTTTGSSVTATVEILTDSATNLQNDEVWLEVSYLGTSGFPTGTLITDRMTDVMTTPADQDSSSVTWYTTGMANPNKQKLVVTFTPQEKGYLIGRVCLAKNATVYVNGELTLS